MQNEHDLYLPSYEEFNRSVSALNLSSSGLHGMMCGFLCAGADSQGEAYLRALVLPFKNESIRDTLLSMFSVYSVSQQLIGEFNFEFNLLLPDEEYALMDRACAFSEWCEGFLQGLHSAGIEPDQLLDEEAQEALQHITEFASLDTDTLDIDEEDEKALMEVAEYTRMAVLRLHAELVTHETKHDSTEKSH